jgi:hypothetical protein
LPVRTPGDWMLLSLILGGVIGGGLAVSGLLASRIAREGRLWRAAAVGAGAEVGTAPDLRIRMVEAWFTGQELPSELRAEPAPSAAMVERLRRMGPATA